MVKVLGHRGAIIPQGEIYQNSLDAFKLALDGADGLETDACLSADGDVFLVHEAKYVDLEVEYCFAEHLDLSSAQIVSGRRLNQLTTEEVSSLRLSNGQAIPRLEQLIELFNGRPEKILNIELKGEGAWPRVLNILESAWREDVLSVEQVVISSFNFPALCELRQHCPEIKLGMLFVPQEVKTVPIFPWSDNTESCYTPLNLAELQPDLIAAIAPQFIIVPHNCLDANLGSKLRQYIPETHLIVWVFTERDSFNQEDFNGKVKLLSADGLLSAIIVDDPNYSLPNH